MPDWGWFVMLFIGYLIVMRWVLPRFSVPT